MDVNFCRFLVLLYVFTVPVTCKNPVQALEDESRPRKHLTVKENINSLVPNDGYKRKTPPNLYLMEFEARRRLRKRSESSSGDDRSRNRLRSGRLSGRKITDTENNEMVVPYREHLRRPMTKESKLTETNRKYDEFTEQVTGQRENNARNVEVPSGFKNSKYEVVGPYRHYVNEESRDSSQSSDEKRKYQIKPDQSDIANSGTKARTEPRKRPRTKYRNSSPGNDSSKSYKSGDDSSSAEDHTKISKDPREKSASTTLKTHFYTLTTQSVDVTAPPTLVNTSFGKVTTSYSTSKQSFNTVKAEITKEILSHLGTTTEASGITSSTLVTTVRGFPTPGPHSGNRMSTELELTTRTFLVTKFPQTKAKRATMTTIRSSKPSPRDPVTIGPVRDFITNQGSIPITIVGIVSSSIVAVAMVVTSSFIGSRRSLIRGRSPSLATLPENIELHDA